MVNKIPPIGSCCKSRVCHASDGSSPEQNSSASVRKTAAMGWDVAPDWVLEPRPSSGHANPLQPTVQPGAASTTWALLRNLCARRDHRQRSGHLPRAFRSRRFGKSSSQTPILASQIVRYTLATQPSSRAQNDKRRAADRRYWLLYASNKRLTISSITGGRAHGPYAAV